MGKCLCSGFPVINTLITARNALINALRNALNALNALKALISTKKVEKCLVQGGNAVIIPDLPKFSLGVKYLSYF